MLCRKLLCCYLIQGLIQPRLNELSINLDEEVGLTWIPETFTNHLGNKF